MIDVRHVDVLVRWSACTESNLSSYVTIRFVMLTKECSGMGSLTFCSSINY